MATRIIEFNQNLKPKKYLTALTGLIIIFSTIAVTGIIILSLLL